MSKPRVGMNTNKIQGIQSYPRHGESKRSTGQAVFCTSYTKGWLVHGDLLLDEMSSTVTHHLLLNSIS